jgi:hypothetical protein
VVNLAAKRRAAASLEQTHGGSERRACRVLSMQRRTPRRQPGQPEREALVARMHVLSECYPHCLPQCRGAGCSAQYAGYGRGRGRRGGLAETRHFPLPQRVLAMSCYS